ncbi:hypothetical protein ABTX71_02100 [Streptomyces parvulus]|uniref:hypothetical protein n=1 Tax=Streptomyces parvulus TaxID=146923 RepID=UPI00332A5CD7
MTAPPDEQDRTPGAPPAPEAGRVDDRILALAAGGVPVRRIAADVGMPRSTVQDRLSLMLRTHTQRASDELIAMREVRLEDLYRRAYATLAGAERGTDAWARAWDRCLRAEESLRKLKGADAPEALSIALERRTDEEAADVVQAVIAAVQAVAATLPAAEGPHREAMQSYALEVAAWELHGREGERPAPPAELPPAEDAPRTAGPYSSGGGGTYIVHNGVRYERAGVHRPADLPYQDAEVVEEYDDDTGDAEAVRAELAKIQKEFPDLFEEDSDGDDPEADTRPAA